MKEKLDNPGLLFIEDMVGIVCNMPFVVVFAAMLLFYKLFGFTRLQDRWNLLDGCWV